MHHTSPNASTYIGRFAPSPSGPLHFGSLVAALASYLDARHNKGKWLLRIDDIDPPREVPGAADTILQQLEAHGLLWDDTELYQSSRSDAYRHALEQLQHNNLLYPCDCSRQAIRAMGGDYNGHCRHRQQPPDNYALRLWLKSPLQLHFDDLIQGRQQYNFTSNGRDDFIVHRRDGLFSYQLACAVDDLHQAITHVIRGSDLLSSSYRQLVLMQLLQADTALPSYGHIPVVMGHNDQKLSKQNLATAIDSQQATENIFTALRWLQQKPPQELQHMSIQDQLSWATQNWCRKKIPAMMEQQSVID